ncbi:hypothetical protein SAMN06269173_1177 [Hymenobacter mucosus]|uniref:Uncharacterized protein n=1 Tax=Hymenobacter mucosus TaxID=1411120 RepID=A0A239B206_9BACT|nr:hypothetical protein SAMN06269173_1177 [Hymenobacter mucosus]
MYYQLSLKDGSGHIAPWVVSLLLLQLGKEPRVRWQLPTTFVPSQMLECLESGTLPLVPAHPNMRPNLRGCTDRWAASAWI